MRLRCAPLATATPPSLTPSSASARTPAMRSHAESSAAALRYHGTAHSGKEVMRLAKALVCFALCLGAPDTARPILMPVTYSDTSECDPLVVPTLVYELGTPPQPPPWAGGS